ncbi:MAG: SDR family oxidoreductase [Candidatus Hatepunaea meridiana]|nr:SDR family oxidoreductase [Candidatus Hatepunaea meridiana]
MPSTRFSDKNIIVTGGTQGLGRSSACYLAEQGASGIVICGRNQENGKKVAKTITSMGCECVYVSADLAKPDDCRHVVGTCDKYFGRVDGLVNAAGLSTRGTLENTTVELWDQLFAVNVRAPFILSQEVARLMKRERIAGSIVNIITISSHGGQPYLTAYCASKGALVTFTKNIAHALRYNRIRVNGLNIGWMDSPNEHIIQKAMGKLDNWLELAEAEQPFKRLLKPLDVAKLVAYLLSDDSMMMTGAIIDFDQNVIGAFD